MTENDKKRALAMVALARKAGKVVTGDGCEKAIREGDARLIFLASDASANSQKKFHNKAAFYGVSIVDVFSKEDIAHHTGLENRAALVIVDENFANKIQEIINVPENNLTSDI